MAAIVSQRAGNWSDDAANGTSPWNGSAIASGLPSAVDTVTLTHTVTVDNTAAACLSLTINAGGTLQPTTSADSTITIENAITVASSALAHILYDMSSAPAYTAKIIVNNAKAGHYSTGGLCSIAGDFDFNGADKTPFSFIAAALVADTTVSVVIEDVTGWRVGDKIVFSSTADCTATPSSRTISNVSYSAGYITLTASAGDVSAVRAGSRVMLQSLQLGVAGVWTVYDVPTSTTFRVATGGESYTITDTAGTFMVVAPVECVTIDSITPTAGTAATVAWSDGHGTAGAVAFAHAAGAIVGNLTRNVVFETGGRWQSMKLTLAATTRTTDGRLTNVMFNKVGCSSGYPYSIIGSSGQTGLKDYSKNAFFDIAVSGAQGCIAWWTNAHAVTIPRYGNVYYDSSAMGSGPFYMVNQSTDIGEEISPVILQAYTGYYAVWPFARVVNPYISGVWTPSGISGGLLVGANNSESNIVEGGAVWSCRNAVGQYGGSGKIDTLRLGCGPRATNAFNARNTFDWISYAGGFWEFNACPENSASGFVISDTGQEPSEIRLFIRDEDAGVYEAYQNQSTTIPARYRETAAAAITRSNFSFAFQWTGTTGTARSQKIKVPAADGIPITLIGFFMKSGVNVPVSGDVAYGASTLPYVEVSGLGITPVRITMDAGTAAGDWEKFSFLPGTATEVVQNAGYDGLLTVEFVGQSAVNGAQCWFSGVPIAPYVTRCRHYGYLFDETSPLRIVDPVNSADQATAIAYTGMAVTWHPAQSDVSITADNTFQKLYDFTRADACLNVVDAVPLTGAGVAGSPVLFAAADIAVSTGFKLNGSGSLSMGAFTLTTEFATAGAYTYTGGTWQQATTVPTFSGGTLNIGAAGVYTFTQAASLTVSATPTAPSDYDLSDCTFTGTLTFHNTSAHDITVQVPSGTSTSSAGSPGAGTVTFVAPVISADISITSMPTAIGASRRLQIINATALSAAAWVANTPYATGALVKRTTGIGTESTAGLYFRATTGGTSHATTEPTWNTTVGGTTTDGTVVWTTYAVLFYDADPAAASLADTYIDGEEFLAGETVTIRFAEMAGATSFKTYSTEVAATADGFSALVAEEADAVYAENALDGSAYESTFSPDFTNNYIVLDTNTDFAGTAAFAYFCYTLTTSNGMYRFWGGVTALDSGNYRINTSVLNLYFNETGAFVKQTDNVRVFRSDGLRPALDPTSGGFGIEINWRVPVNVVSTGGSALTPAESAYLLALPSAADVWNHTLP